MSVATAIFMGGLMGQAGAICQPPTRGPATPNHGVVYSLLRLPTDSIGSFTLTLTNLVVDSVVRVETQAGALVELRTAASSTESFSVPAYSVGSANNDLRIKVRKGSAAPFYRPFETLATALVGAQSIYIAQIQDD
jgi:hypothetical protein